MYIALRLVFAKYTVYILKYILYLYVLILHFKVMLILSILHRDNVSLQTNIFFEPYLDDIVPCMTI